METFNEYVELVTNEVEDLILAKLITIDTPIQKIREVYKSVFYDENDLKIITAGNDEALYIAIKKSIPKIKERQQ